MTGWIIDGDGRVEVHATYEPQRWYVVALVLTALGLVLCVVAILWPRRKPT